MPATYAFWHENKKNVSRIIHFSNIYNEIKEIDGQYYIMA